MQNRLSDMVKATILATALAGAWPANAQAQEADCFDAEISARIVRQTPTVVGECDDCIIVRWPWIIDLDILRVHAGEVDRGRLSVLTIQHTDFRDDPGPGRWKLRRNTSGGFNVVGFGEEPGRRCSRNEPPARPYITPRAGQTIEDLRREGQAYYGRDN